jgi:hypothetical protein
MKSKIAKKLTLTKESIKNLSRKQLARAAGGWGDSDQTSCCTAPEGGCPTFDKNGCWFSAAGFGC